MKLTGHILAALLLLTALAACHDDTESPRSVLERSDVELTLRASNIEVGYHTTRAAAEARNHALGEGDTVGVYVLEGSLYLSLIEPLDGSDPSADRVSYFNVPCTVLPDGTLTPVEEGMHFFYPKGNDGKLQGVGIVAYYPYNKDYTFDTLLDNFDLTVQPEQTTGRQLAMSDFMFGEPAEGAGLVLQHDGPVSLQFEHMMCCLLVEVQVPATTQVLCDSLTLAIDGIATGTKGYLMGWASSTRGVSRSDTQLGTVTARAEGISQAQVAEATDSITRTFAVVVAPDLDRAKGETTFCINLDDRRVERTDTFAVAHRPGYIQRYRLRLTGDQLTFTDTPSDPGQGGL